MANIITFETELNYYIAHQNEIVEKYDGKHIIIIGEEVIKALDTFEEAYLYGRNTLKLEAGKFMIQLCGPGKENYTRKI